MGATISRLARRFLPKTEIRILMVGLDASGKTTILYKLKLGEIVLTVPTIGIYPNKLSPFHDETGLDLSFNGCLIQYLSWLSLTVVHPFKCCICLGRP